LLASFLVLFFREGDGRADSTKLLEVDLRTGSKRSIDPPKSAADRELDALVGGGAGGSFSTAELEKIENALRRYLGAARLRATPRMILFLYPGRISRNSLRELREVKVDVELVVDPCSRSICTDSVAKSVEFLGKSIRQAVLRAGGYTIRFGVVVIRTTTEIQGTEFEVYRFGAEEVVQAGQQAGGGNQLVSQLVQAKESYARQMTKEVANRVKQRRVRLTKAPLVERDTRAVNVALEIQSDRVRYRTEVLGALMGAAEALRKSPLTPPTSNLQVVASIQMRGVEQHTFSCQGQPLGLFLDGRLSQSEIWSTYIVEKKKGGTQLDFSDDEASGRGGGKDDEDLEEDRTQEVLAAHFNLLAPCLSAEATRSRSFRGATLKFAISKAGRAQGLSLKEGGSAALRSCLEAALGQIRFQKHGGAPRQVEYPMVIKR